MKVKANSLLWSVVFYLLGAVALKAWAAQLTIKLDNPPENGTVYFALFDSANTFGDLREPTKLVKRHLDGRPVYRIENIVPGEYALLVYYDENDNARMDKNFIGIPKELLGFSNRYRPKGPPSYSRAVFVLAENEEKHFDVKLYRPLGKRGRIGVGVGVIAQTAPYRDYDSGVVQVIPAITYNGNRLQLYGPRVQFGLVGSGKLRLAATGQYRIGAYEDDESDFLEGLGDRKDTFMAGLALQVELPGGVDLSAGYEHDVLDEIGGGIARLSMDKGFQYGVFRFSPELGINWLSEEIANHDFGVPASKGTAGRPAYDVDSAINFEAGIGLFVEITHEWLVFMNVACEFLDDEVTDSPIVEDDYVVKGFAALNYVF